MNCTLIRTTTAIAALAIAATLGSPASAATCEQLAGAEANMAKLVQAVDAKQMQPLDALNAAALGLRSLPDVNKDDLDKIDATVKKLTEDKAGADKVKEAFGEAAVRLLKEKQAKKCA